MRRRLWAVDCETDKFLKGRIPRPFIWGAFDGKKYKIFHSTKEFVEWAEKQTAILYAHNGGKFDFMFLMPYMTAANEKYKETRTRIIGGRFAEMTLGKAKLRDSFSIIPVPLSDIQKDEIDYNKMEKGVRENNMPEIISYLKTDVRVLWEAVNAYRNIAGKQLTIASNAMASSRKLGVDPGRTNYRFDCEFRPYYFGGRTECFQPGTHLGGRVIDIVSSYPKAMTNDHPTGDERVRTRKPDALDHMSTEEIQKSFIHCKCYSAGAFPFRNAEGGLDFPSRFGEYHVTGWEYLVAKKHNLIKDLELISVTTFEKTINFTPYIDKWFEHKKNHPKAEDPVNYTIGKIMQNSLYGKLSQNPLKYFDYRICDPGTEIDWENGWKLYTEFEGQEIHRREAKWNFQYKYGVDWVKRPLYFNVATGASVTGYARAALLDAIHTVGEENVIYCDTDSLVLHECDISGLSMGKELGQWESEGDVIIGHFAGKKLYGLKFEEIDPKTGKNKYKIASKGNKISYDHTLDKLNPELGMEHLERVISGEKILIESAAPSFSIANGINFCNRYVSLTV